MHGFLEGVHDLAGMDVISQPSSLAQIINIVDCSGPRYHAEPFCGRIFSRKGGLVFCSLGDPSDDCR